MQVQPIERSPNPKRVRVDGVPNLYVRPKDGRYEVGYTGSDGRWHIVTLKSAQNLTQAKRAMREILTKRDMVQDVAPSRLTFSEVAAEFFATFESLVLSGEKSERTLELYHQRYQTHLAESLGRQRVQNITAKHIADVLAQLRAKRIKRSAKDEPQPLSSWTVQGIFTLAGSILQFAVVRGYRTDNPISRLSKSERPRAKNATEARVLTADEIRRLIGKTITTYKAAIATACFTGLRSQELLALRWEDVQLGRDEEPSFIMVRNQLTRATRKRAATFVPLKTDASRRDIEIPPQLAKLLRAHKLASRYSRPGDYLFTTETGNPIYYRNLASRGLDKAATRAGLNPEGKQKLSLHDLRHTAISQLIRAGADVGQVARFAGHARPSMTLDKYLHEFDAREGNDVASRLGAAFSDVL